MKKSERQTVERIHTAARHYLSGRIHHLRKQSAETRNHPGRVPNSEEQLNVSDRCLMAARMLGAVERFTAADFSSPNVAREGLAEAAERAKSFFGEVGGTIQDAVRSEERARFSTYIRSVPVSKLQAIDPLPFRRVLPQHEMDVQSRRLANALGIPRPYWYPWYPLTETTRADVVAFVEAQFQEAISNSFLADALRSRGVERVWLLREFEFSFSYEKATELIEPTFATGGCDEVWFSDEMDWVIYVSHLSSITIGEQWLIAEIQARWPGWEESIWSYEKLRLGEY